MATKTFKIGLSNQDKQNMAQDVYERVLALTFAEYDSAETYNEGDFVVYNDLLYKCLEDNVTGTWDATKWQQATLQDVVDDVEDAVVSVEHKANVDGNYPTMTVGVADNLSPYDESSGDDQDEPFSFQATGTGNGTQPDFSTGSIALMKEKQGNTVVVNQKVKNGDFSQGTSNWRPYDSTNTSISVNNGVLSQTFLSDGSSYKYGLSQTVSGYPVGHKILFILSINTPFPGYYAIDFDGSTTGKIFQVSNANTWETKFVLYTNANGQSGVTYEPLVTVTQGSVVQYKNIAIIDITQWFNGDIPQDLLDNPENFFRYYQGSLAYNEGALVNANGRYIKCIGMNQWDEETELGSYNTLTGEKVNDSSKIRNKNPISVIPNTQYVKYSNNNGVYWLVFYDANMNYIERQGINVGSNTFTTPSNACYMNMLFESAYGTTYNNDISINLYYEDEPRCLTYEPYELLTNNDTGTEVLRSAGSVKDSKAPDGTITRRIGVVDLGSLDWSKDNIQEGMFATSGIQTTVKKYRGANLLSKIYINSGVSSFDNMPDMTAQIFDSGAVYCKNLNAYSTMNAEQFKTAMSGVYLFYELAKPTTEQGTPYSENLVIDDFGSMDFSGTNGVPQGALIFYPVDYKAFVDTLYNYTKGTPSNLALNSELDDKFESYLKSLSGYDANATQVLKNVEGTLTWVTEGE